MILKCNFLNKQKRFNIPIRKAPKKRKPRKKNRILKINNRKNFSEMILKDLKFYTETAHCVTDDSNLECSPSRHILVKLPNFKKREKNIL